jgi:hypothetical protein
MIEVGVVALLLADTDGVAALVGNRIDALVLPLTPVFPAITYGALPSQAEELLDGSISEQTERIRIDCYGLTYLDAANVAQAVHNLLDTYDGVLPDGTVAQVIERSSGQDFFLSDQKVYGKSIDFTFWF